LEQQYGTPSPTRRECVQGCEAAVWDGALKKGSGTGLEANPPGRVFLVLAKWLSIRAINSAVGYRSPVQFEEERARQMVQ